MRTEEQMKSDMHKTRNIGHYIPSTTLARGEIKKGVHVMTPEGLAVVTGIMERPNEGVFVDVVVYGGNPNGQSFRPYELRLATFREFCRNRSGFGKTSWVQFCAIQGLAIALAIAGVATAREGGWLVCLLALAIEGVLMYGTWRNFKGGQA